MVASVGAFALGAASLRGQNVTGLTQQERTKWWILSGEFGTFYDDNTLNLPKASAEGSFGFTLKPGIAINLPLQRTLVTASYDFTANYYRARVAHKIDQDHNFDALLNHKFSPNSEFNFRNSFVYSDSPAITDSQSVSISGRTDLRSKASGYRNNLALDYSKRFTPTIGTVIGYKNNLRDYSASGFNSYSALLDSVEHLFNIDAQWYTSMESVYFVGYQFGILDYTSNDPIGIRNPDPFPSPNEANVYSDEKNSLSHYFYLGARREFSRRLQSSAVVGVQLTDYYNDFPSGTTTWTPFVDVSATYTYLPGSNVKLGINVFHSPTDAGVDASTAQQSLSKDQLSTAVSLNVNHRITSRITGTGGLRYQNSVYNGGTLDGSADNYFTLSLGADYKIRENLFANASYGWTSLTSDRAGLAYTKNRIYLGVRATY